MVTDAIRRKVSACNLVDMIPEAWKGGNSGLGQPPYILTRSVLDESKCDPTQCLNMDQVFGGVNSILTMDRSA